MRVRRVFTPPAAVTKHVLLVQTRNARSLLSGGKRLGFGPVKSAAGVSEAAQGLSAGPTLPGNRYAAWPLGKRGSPRHARHGGGVMSKDRDGSEGQSTPLLVANHSGVAAADDSALGEAGALSQRIVADALAQRSAQPAQLAPGTLLAGRYRLVRLLGRGGMGEVFEAEDLKLQRRVALKTILPDIAQDARAMERFRREVQLSLNVTDPHVCRIYNLEDHVDRDGSITFLTMELLPGETLADKLKRDTRLAPHEALPIVLQVTQALEAAHAAGIVHRDLKPSNVMLVPAGGTTRAVVADFGLARHTGGQQNALTQTDDVLGTPLYMAPEQVEGKPISTVTDIYALGAVMFEMVTGRPPFLGETPMAIAIKRLHEDPPAPRLLVPSLDRAWDAVILQCLERRPEDRFSSAAEVREALLGERDSRLTSRQRRLIRAWVTRVVATAVVAAAVFAGWRFWPRQSDLGLGPHPTVAVLGFHNDGSPDEAWVGTALSELLSRELGAGDALRAVPMEDVARMRAELPADLTGPLPEPLLQKLRKSLGVDAVVIGRYTSLGKASGGQLQVAVTVQSATTGRVRAPLVREGHVESLFDLGSEVGQSLRGSLSPARLTPSEEKEARASLPHGTIAQRFYAEGLDRLRMFDNVAALDFLKQAANADPTSATIRSTLAEAYSVLGYDSLALDSAKLANQLAEQTPGISRAERLAIECRFKELGRDWDQAIAACRALTKVSVSEDATVRLARLEVNAERWADALKTVAASPPSPRLDLVAAEAYQGLNQATNERASAEKALELARDQGSKTMEAQATLALCMALINLRSAREAKTTCADARDLAYALGDGIMRARAVTNLGHAHAIAAEPDQARTNFESAVHLSHQVGSGRDESEALMNLGLLWVDQGKVDQALPLYRQALVIAETIGDKTSQALILQNMGEAERANKETAQAVTSLQQALRLNRELGATGRSISTLVNLGLLKRQTQLREARLALQEARTAAEKEERLETAANASFYLGDIAFEMDEPVDSMSSYLRAAEGATRIGDPVLTAAAQIGRARSLLAVGRAVEADEVIEKALNNLGDKDADVRAWGLGLRTLCVSVLGRFKEVPELARQARDAIAKSTDPESIRVSAIATARALMNIGQTAQARQLAREARNVSQSLADPGMRLEPELLESRLLLKNDAVRAHGQLRSLAIRAEQLGYQRLANEARGKRTT